MPSWVFGAGVDLLLMVGGPGGIPFFGEMFGQGDVGQLAPAVPFQGFVQPVQCLRFLPQFQKHLADPRHGIRVSRGGSGLGLKKVVCFLQHLVLPLVFLELSLGLHAFSRQPERAH